MARLLWPFNRAINIRMATKNWIRDREKAEGILSSCQSMIGPSFGRRRDGNPAQDLLEKVRRGLPAQALFFGQNQAVGENGNG